MNNGIHKIRVIKEKEKIRHASGESNQKLSLLLIMIGLFLLAASLYVASLT